MSETKTHGHGHAQPGADPESIAIGHELKDARIRPLVISGFVLGALIVVSFIFMAILMVAAGVTVNQTGNTLPDDAVAQLQVPPSPRLEQNPRGDTDAMVAEANAKLESFGWVDQQANTAHISIERAMGLIVERGVDGK
jgi:hypothetical protein